MEEFFVLLQCPSEPGRRGPEHSWRRPRLAQPRAQPDSRRRRLSPARGVRRPLRPLGGAAGQLFRRPRPARWSAAVRVRVPVKSVRSRRPRSRGLPGGFLSWLHDGDGAALLLPACFLLCQWKHRVPGCPPVPAQLAVARVPWPSWDRLTLTKPHGDPRRRGRWPFGKVTQHFKSGVRTRTRVPGSPAGVRTRACARLKVGACGLLDLGVGRAPGILSLVFAFLPPSLLGLRGCERAPPSSLPRPGLA